jgi:hypothetical protein
MEYPRAGDGWPHYSSQEAQADAILRAAGLAWMLPACVAETAEQRAEREASARARAAELEAQAAAQAAWRAQREADELALRAEMLRAQWEQSLPASMRAYGPVVDCAGRRVAAVRWYDHLARVDRLEIRTEDGRVLQHGEAVVDPRDSRERIVCAGQGMTLVATTATSEWLPRDQPKRLYFSDYDAGAHWSEWDPYAQQRAAKHAAKAAKAAARGTPAPAAPASPFAALAALRTEP